jgi:uncharacterized membrane protein YeaQ/YmgE (transglycosylase-associated protein family)
MLNKLTILLIHIIVGLVFGYLSYAIMTGQKIPFFVGILLGLVALTVVVAHFYIFVHKSNTTDHYKANDPEYNPIGGAGGLGFL